MAEPNPYEVAGGYYGGYVPPPYYGSVPPPRPPFMNFGRPSGPIEGIAQSLLPMLAETLRGQVGGSVFTFGADMNVLSAKFAQQFVQQLNQARNTGAQADAPQVEALVRGLARLIGNDVNDPLVKGAVGRLSGDLTSMLPILAAAFPNQLDRWLPQGSFAVAAANFVSANRFVIDPKTGLPLSQDAGFMGRVATDLIRDPVAVSGLTAGRVGQTYEQLVSRGLIAGDADLRRQVELGESLGGIAGGMTGDKARQIQADRIKRQLSDYSKAVAAIVDIFAEAGRPDAPMPELIANLERLTGGTLGTVDPASAARTLRVAQAVANRTGMSVGVQTSRAVEIGETLRQMGLSPTMGAGVSSYTAVLAQQYANAGLVVSGPEGQSLNDITNRQTRLLTAGLGSDALRSVGAVLALGAQAGAGTPLRDVYDAIRGQKASISIGGQTYDTLRMTPEQINDLAARSGLGSGAYQRQLMATGQVSAALANNQDVATWATGQLQQEYARQLLTGRLRMFAPSLSDEQIGQAYDLIQAQISKGGFSSDAELARIVGGQMGLTTAQLSELTTGIGIAGDGEGWRRFADANPQLRRSTEEEFPRGVGKQAEAMERLAPYMRGGWRRIISRTLGEYGTGRDRSTLGWVLRGLGLVDDEELDNQLYGAAGGDRRAADQLFGRAGRPYDPARIEADAARRNAAMDDVIKMVDRPVQNGGLGGGFGRGVNADRAPGGVPGAGVPKKAGDPVGVDKPANVQIQITGATFEIRDGKISITGGGAITGMA